MGDYKAFKIGNFQANLLRVDEHLTGSGNVTTDCCKGTKIFAVKLYLLKERFTHESAFLSRLGSEHGN